MLDGAILRRIFHFKALATMHFSGRTFMLMAVLVALSIGPAAAVNYCPPVWTQYQLKTGSFCYRLFSQPKTWQEAEATCRRYTLCQGLGIEVKMETEKELKTETGKETKIEMGGERKTSPERKAEMETAHLVSIGSAEEEDFVSSYWKEMWGPFEGEQGIWLGNHKIAPTSGNLWAWLDKLRTPYENWGTRTSRNTAGNCSRQVATQYAWPRWDRVNCDSKQQFISDKTPRNWVTSLTTSLNLQTVFVATLIVVLHYLPLPLVCFNVF